MAPKYRFSEGERVLCFHGPLLYEAKCIKSEVKDKVVKYYVHYQGWNKSWDEWVPENRVLKYNEANIEKQQELQTAHNEAKPKKSRKVRSSTTPATAQSTPEGDKEFYAASPTPVVTTPAVPAKESTINSSKKKKKPNPATDDDESNSAVVTGVGIRTTVEIKIKIPDELKPILVDDHHLINGQKKLVTLPAVVNVEKILQSYLESKQNEKDMTPSKESGIDEICKGIGDYFNCMLGSQLLYKFERPQYQQLILDHPKELPSKLYGFIHLLRLFVKLGGMLVQTILDQKSLDILLVHLHDFLKFLNDRRSKYYKLDDYFPSTPDYLKKTVQ